MAVTIRIGNAADMQAVLPLLYRRLEERAAVDPAFYALRPDAPARFRHWLGPALEDPRHALVVAEEDGTIVGCLAATVERDLPIFVCDEYAVVRVLWVEPTHRGRGIAGLMLKHAEKECAQFGLRQLRATAAVARDVERHVLDKAGFRAAGVTFLRELEPVEPAADAE